MRRYRNDDKFYDEIIDLEKEDDDEYEEDDEDEDEEDYDEDDEDEDEDDDDGRNPKLVLATKIGAVIIGLTIIAMAIYFLVNKAPNKFESASNVGHSHVYAEDFTIDEPATCKKDGSKSRHCTFEGCTATIDVTTIPKSEHDWDDGRIVKEPTCTEEGEKKYICLICGEERIDPIFPLDHAYGPGETKEGSSCTEAGEITYECTRCGYKKTESIPPSKHDLDDEIYMEGDEDDDNVEYYRICKKCGNHVYTDENGDVIESEHNKTVTKKVSDSDKPSSCKSGNHKWVEAGSKIEATCKREGKITRVCSECGEEETETIPKKPHNFETIIEEPTCVTTGSKTKKCKDCGYVEEKTTLEMTDHNYGSPTVVDEGDCKHDKILRYECKDCGHTREEKVASSVGHDFQVSTYTENGYLVTVDKCKVCGIVRSKVVTEDDGESSNSTNDSSSSQSTESGVIVISN